MYTLRQRLARRDPPAHRPAIALCEGAAEKLLFVASRGCVLLVYSPTVCVDAGSKGGINDPDKKVVNCRKRKCSVSAPYVSGTVEQ